MTKAQSHALSRLDEYLITDGSQISSLFHGNGPVAIEIGFGMGHSLAQYAAINPNSRCIGVDVYLPGIGALIQQCEVQEIHNVRISNQEGKSFLETVMGVSISLWFFSLIHGLKNAIIKDVWLMKNSVNVFVRN